MLQAKSVIQAVCLGLRQLVLKPGFRPKERALGMLEKSENFNSLRLILYELCKITTGGVKLPPPAGIGLTDEFAV